MKLKLAAMVLTSALALVACGSKQAPPTTTDPGNGGGGGGDTPTPVQTVTVKQEFGTYANGTFTPSATPDTASVAVNTNVTVRATITNPTADAVTGSFYIGLATVNDAPETNSNSYGFAPVKEPMGAATKFPTDPKGFGYDSITVPANGTVEVIFTEKFGNTAKVCDKAVLTPTTGTAADNTLCFNVQ